MKILRRKRKSLDAVQKLPTKQQRQSSPIWVKMGWIGCAIQQATSKGLPGFFFRFDILFFIFLNIKPLRPMRAHFCPLIFQPQVLTVQGLVHWPKDSCPLLAALVLTHSLSHYRQNLLANLITDYKPYCREF